ncbi:MAG TPA: glutamine synthetase family protein [bacterium]|nr:glutamine synthetase family protein [bacterium]
MNTLQDIKGLVKKSGVQLIRLCFTDIIGDLKGFNILPAELDKAAGEGLGVDGSSIEGFARINESDLVAVPDLDTFKVLPVEFGNRELRYALVFCDLFTPGGSPYPGDPRFVLKSNLDKLKAESTTFYVGPELEFFYVKGERDPEPLDHCGYHDASLISKTAFVCDKTLAMLGDEGLGIRGELNHHEVGPSQYEVDLRYADALVMADQVMLVKLLIKEVARMYGIHATFMPKPIFRENGSGMHVHQSLFKDGKNLFVGEGGSSPLPGLNLSDFAFKYTAGILAHIREATLVLNQWVNSYKRLVPGYEAPCYIVWGHRNRSALVRVPHYNTPQSARIELRSPDPACNPYLAFSAMLAMGMKGVEGAYELTEPTEENMYDAGQRGSEIQELPESLSEAIHVFEKSDLMRETLGDHVFEKFIANKTIEWDSYRQVVTGYEIQHSLPRL